MSQQPCNDSQTYTLVFVHGWGMNRGVWEAIEPSLFTLVDSLEGADIRCKLKFVDLLGYGERATKESDIDSQNLKYDLATLADDLNAQIPKNSVLIAWSLGGLVASIVAERRLDIKGLITVASSPKFAGSNEWSGIDVDVLMKFKQQLIEQQQATIKRFIAIQNMGVDNQRYQNKLIQESIFQYPLASTQALSDGLDILLNDDIRLVLRDITCPHLAMFGRLDSLVPYAVIPQILEYSPNTQVKIFQNAAHAPFLSHTDDFISTLENYLKLALA